MLSVVRKSVGAACVAVTLFCGTAKAATLYGLSAAQKIYSINVSTGVATEIIDLGLGVNSALSMTASPDGLLVHDRGANKQYLEIALPSLTVTPLGMVPSTRTVNGIDYNANGDLFAIDSGLDDLSIQDPITGSVTVIGTPTGGNPYYSGLAFSPAGDLFTGLMSTSLMQLDPLTGVGTTIGAYDAITLGLAFDANGTLFGAERNGPSNSGSSLVTLNPLTGSALSRIPIVGIDSSIVALDFSPLVVPEPTSLGLLAIGAVALLRRRRERC